MTTPYWHVSNYWQSLHLLACAAIAGVPPFDAMSSRIGANTQNNGGNPAESWETLRANGDIQFAPVAIPDQPPGEPGWLERLLEWLGDQLSPLGGLFGSAWPTARWILLALLISAILFILYRLLEPLIAARRKPSEEMKDPHWQPDRRETLALLEDADRLAGEGRFDEAAHLLLQRSIHQIAAARPDWVEPSTTARELAAIRALPAGAREAFSLIAQRVERSLFALRQLDEMDWRSARAAYAEFALVQIDGPPIDGTRIDGAPR